MELIEIFLDEEDQHYLDHVEDYFLQFVFIGYGIEKNLFRCFQSSEESAPGLLLESQDTVYIGSDSQAFTLAALEKYMGRPEVQFIFPYDRSPENYNYIPKFYQFFPRYTFHRWENPYLLNGGELDWDDNYFKIQEVDESMYDKLKNNKEFAHHFIFLKEFSAWSYSGGGIAVIDKDSGKVVSLSSSLLRFHQKIEVLVTTLEKYQRRHFGLASCHHFLIKCVRSKLTPYWNCEDYRHRDMAVNLGFQRHQEYFMLKQV